MLLLDTFLFKEKIRMRLTLGYSRSHTAAHTFKVVYTLLYVVSAQGSK